MSTKKYLCSGRVVLAGMRERYFNNNNSSHTYGEDGNDDARWCFSLNALFYLVTLWIS